VAECDHDSVFEAADGLIGCSVQSMLWIQPGSVLHAAVIITLLPPLSALVTPHNTSLVLDSLEIQMCC